MMIDGRTGRLLTMLFGLCIAALTGVDAQGQTAGGAETSGTMQAVYFEDTFDGEGINSVKWNADEAIGGLRWCSSTASNHHSSPGNWQDVSVAPCNGYTDSRPYGYVTVANGTASFGSSYKRTFPYIWTGAPSRPSPFPASGDFILEVRMKYDAVLGHGDGFQALVWTDSDPVGNNPPAGQGFRMSIWADGSGLNASWGNVAPWYSPEALAYHVYRFEYISGKYSFYLDGVLKQGPFASSARPNAIWIGNPVFTHWGMTDWSDFTIDYVRVTVPNRAPVADAGPDQTVECAGPSGAEVTLDGSGSSDADSDSLTYSWTWSGGTAAGVNPVVTLPLGTHAVMLTVDDGRGGSATDTVQITVRDTTPPVTALRSIAGIPGDNGWYRSDLMISVDAVDVCSGVKEIRSVVDGAPSATPGSTAAIRVEGDGTHGLTYGAVDNAGNIEPVHTVAVGIDKTPPSIIASVSGQPNQYGWYSGDVTVTFTCADAVSGVASCSDPVVVSAEGAGQVIAGTAVDKAGNRAETSVTVNIDKTAPVVDLSAAPGLLWPPNHKMIDVLVSGGSSDSLSGIASAVFTVRDEYGTVQPAVKGFNTVVPLEAWREGNDKDGRHYTITAVITDKAGNTSTSSTEVVCPHDMRDK